MSAASAQRATRYVWFDQDDTLYNLSLIHI